MKMGKKFIDISEHNTILSFNGMFESNLSGVIMKATEGTTYQDHAMEVLYDAIKDNLPIGFYHYLTATSEPETQAQNFWNMIQDKEYQISPVIDVEQDKLGYKAQSYTERFMSEFFRLSGQNMLVYSGRCYIEEHFDVSFRNANMWWVADYSDNEPSILGCHIVAWQYTENAQNYSFTMGNLDVNNLLDEENFFIENYVPFSEPVENNFSKSIARLQNELNVQGCVDKNGNELGIDGIAGELTLSACPTLRVGAIGNITKWVQHEIAPWMNIDGIFGEETRQAVIEYQENRSLDGDGIVGKNTWRKLLGL
jgi:GH25 family lysozyme M1 (1,4-beta-N-acetylmuramidase)